MPRQRPMPKAPVIPEPEPHWLTYLAEIRPGNTRWPEKGEQGGWRFLNTTYGLNHAPETVKTRFWGELDLLAKVGFLVYEYEDNDRNPSFAFWRPTEHTSWAEVEQHLELLLERARTAVALKGTGTQATGPLPDE